MSNSIDEIILSYEKSVVLNAIYDVVDALGLIAEHINSERGVLVIRTPDKAQMRVMVDTVFPSKDTKVGLAVERGLQSEWVHTFFDELRSTLTIGYKRKSL